MTVFIIACTFVIFVLILMIILVYLQHSSTNSNKFKKRVERSKKRIEPIFLKLVNNKKIKEEHIKELKRCLTNKAEITAFNDIYSNYVTKNGKNNHLKDIISNVITDDVLFQRKIYCGKYRKDYILYLYDLYEIVNDSSIKFSFDNLKSNSLYTRNNVIRVIENSLNVNDFIRVLSEIDDEEYYISEKIIVDFLVSFKGNREELNHSLVEKMNGYSEMIRRLVINYFVIKKCDTKEIKEVVLDVFKENRNSELIISAIKYFGVVHYDKAQKYFNDYLNSDVVEIKIVSSKFAYKYPNEISKKRVKSNLMDANWYVRNNAAYSLVRMDYNELDVKEILENKDRFAKETFEQALNNKKVK